MPVRKDFRPSWAGNEGELVVNDKAGDASVPMILWFSDGTEYNGTATMFTDGTANFSTIGSGY